MERTLIIGAAIALGLGLIGLWAFVSSSPETDIESLVYIDDPQQIERYVELPRLGILTSENFVGHRIRVIEGTVRNISDRTLHSVELHLAFNSFDGEAVLESDEEALRTPLPPGGERTYTFRFENLPADWNYRVPEVTVLRVGYPPA